MRPLSRSLALAALLLPLGLGTARAADCRARALDHLRTASPDGFAIFQGTSQPDFFKGWIDCRDAQFDLPTAVHESTHFIAAETDAFPLIGGGSVDRPHAVSAFFPPARIADRFPADDFASIYLRRGRASSATDVLYLLDELNAYSHDLATAVDLRSLSAADEAIDHRDGLAALMAFVTVYAETARGRDPETWAGLRSPEVAKPLAVLWSQAERVMQSSCGIPNYGTHDAAYLALTCTAEASKALAPILGRAPVCADACLAPASDERLVPTQSSVGSDDDGASPHPFGVRAGPPRHMLRGKPD